MPSVTAVASSELLGRIGAKPIFSVVKEKSQRGTVLGCERNG
jgi:hypothetical protein